MRIAVLGAGGIGGYYGARLAKAGHDVVLTVQNGLDRADALATALGEAKAVLAGAVYAALQLAGPGVVVRTGPEARIAFGERGGAASDRTARLAAAFRESAEGRALLAASCGEIVAVAEAEGAPLRSKAAAAALAQASTLPAGWRSSMARDLEEGRRLEVDALSGTVVLRGRRAGVPTPVHQAVTACLSLP